MTDARFRIEYCRVKTFCHRRWIGIFFSAGIFDIRFRHASFSIIIIIYFYFFSFGEEDGLLLRNFYS